MLRISIDELSKTAKYFSSSIMEKAGSKNKKVKIMLKGVNKICALSMGEHLVHLIQMFCRLEL